MASPNRPVPGRPARHRAAPAGPVHRLRLPNPLRPRSSWAVRGRGTRRGATRAADRRGASGAVRDPRRPRRPGPVLHPLALRPGLGGRAPERCQPPRLRRAARPAAPPRYDPRQPRPGGRSAGGLDGTAAGDSGGGLRPLRAPHPDGKRPCAGARRDARPAPGDRGRPVPHGRGRGGGGKGYGRGCADRGRRRRGATPLARHPAGRGSGRACRHRRARPGPPARDGGGAGPGLRSASGGARHDAVRLAQGGAGRAQGGPRPRAARPAAPRTRDRPCQPRPPRACTRRGWSGSSARVTRRMPTSSRAMRRAGAGPSSLPPSSTSRPA